MTSSHRTPAKALTVFSLVMITVGSVDSIRNLPATAMFGSSLIFFFILAAIFFLLPSALVSAELASGWPEQGGIYIWVKHAFGDRAALMAVWFQWIENVIWYPTILSFVAGTIGYLISPSLAQNKYFLVAIILIAFWGTTIVNFFGMKLSAMFSSVCAMFGLLLPMLLIISLGFIWVMKGMPLQIHFTRHDMLPHAGNSDLWISLTGIVLSFCGMEIATVHARDVHEPQKAFPKAITISIVILLVTLIGGSLAIAVVLPGNQISLVAGLMQAFNAFFSAYHMHWIMPLIAVMLVLGGMGGVNNWIIAPTKGLLVAAQDGHLPMHLRVENRHGAPVALLIYQAIIVTALSLVFLLMPSVNGAYWFLTVLAAQLYMFMYFMMFVVGIYLRYKAPLQERVYSIPGGKLGMWLVAGCGIIGVTVTVIVGFIPPSDMRIGSASHYDIMLLLALIVMSAPPLLLYHSKKIFVNRRLA